MTWRVHLLFLSPYEGRGVSVKTLCLCDWPSSKQRCIDASASPLAPRPVLTNALLGGFVQPEWLQHLAEIYSTVRRQGCLREMNCSAGGRLWVQIPGDRFVSVSESRFIRRHGLFTGRIMNAYVHRRHGGMVWEKGGVAEVGQRWGRDFSASGAETRKFIILQRLREHRWQISILVWQLQSSGCHSTVSDVFSLMLREKNKCTGTISGESQAIKNVEWGGICPEPFDTGHPLVHPVNPIFICLFRKKRV